MNAPELLFLLAWLFGLVVAAIVIVYIALSRVRK
jgi:hypothetical protein